MKLTVLKTVLALALPLAFAVGCAHTPPSDQAALYGPEPNLALTPTSERAVTRVYPGDIRPDGIIWPPSDAPNGAADNDWALSEEIRSALTTDKSLAPYPSDVSVTVDKNAKGTVRLQGFVPNDYEKRRLRERMAQVPGVQTVDDQVEVGLTKHQGQMNLSQ